MDIGSLNDWTKGSANRASTTSVATRKVEALQERNTTAGQAHEPEPASLERIAEAVGNIQEFVQTVRRDINFSLDDSTGRVVVKVTDRVSGDTIRQIPTEEALRLAESLEEARSLLFKAKA